MLEFHFIRQEPETSQSKYLQILMFAGIKFLTYFCMLLVTVFEIRGGGKLEGQSLSKKFRASSKI